MIEDKLAALLNAEKINKFQYDTYLLFGATEIGRKYLANMVESVLVEKAPPIREGFAYQDGRRSWWGEIKTTINVVNLKLEGKLDDIEC